MRNPVTNRRCVKQPEPILFLGLLASLITACPDTNEPPAPGSVALSFSEGSEKYLVSVFAVPATDEVSGSATYTLNAGGTDNGAGALKFQTRHSALHRHQEHSGDQLTYDAWRRQGINALVDSLQQGMRSLRPRLTVRSAVTEPCSRAQMKNDGACVSELSLNIPSTSDTITAKVIDTLGQDGNAVAVLIDKRNESDATTAKEVAQDFQNTLELEQTLFGMANHGEADRDKDGRIAIVFTNAPVLGPDGRELGILGFFAFEDFLRRDEINSSGNERDILWVRVPSDNNTAGSITKKMATGTLVHEYAHLVSFAKRVYGLSGDQALREVLWLDEGIAHLTEDLCGWGPSNIRTVEAALDNWNSAGFALSNDSVEMRGQAYLFLRHMIDTKARMQGATHATDDAAISAATNIVSNLVHGEGAGFGHTIFQGSSANRIWNWLLGVYATGNEDVTVEQAKEYNYLAPATSSETGNLVGIAPYETMPDAHEVGVRLLGPEITQELSEPAETVEDDVNISGSHFYIVSSDESGEFTLTVTTEDSGVQLHIRSQRIN